MASMSIRGLDDQALARLKRQAEQEGTSLNNLVLRLLQGAGTSNQPGALKKFDDLDAGAILLKQRQLNFSVMFQQDVEDNRPGTVGNFQPDDLRWVAFNQ